MLSDQILIKQNRTLFTLFVALRVYFLVASEEEVVAEVTMILLWLWAVAVVVVVAVVIW
jgi:hypothetical protein